MSKRLRCALFALQWVVGIVILREAAFFAVSPHAAQAFARTGLPNFVRVGLAWAEMVAAVLFLVPRTLKVGGWLLIAVLVVAVVIHLLHRWWDVGPLLVYAAATWTVMEGKRVAP